MCIQFYKFFDQNSWISQPKSSPGLNCSLFSSVADCLCKISDAKNLAFAVVALVVNGVWVVEIRLLSGLTVVACVDCLFSEILLEAVVRGEVELVIWFFLASSKRWSISSLVLRRKDGRSELDDLGVGEDVSVVTLNLRLYKITWNYVYLYSDSFISDNVLLSVKAYCYSKYQQQEIRLYILIHCVTLPINSRSMFENQLSCFTL